MTKDPRGGGSRAGSGLPSPTPSSSSSHASAHTASISERAVIGEAERLVPRMEADVGLMDIEPGYGYNTFPACAKVKRLWVWGSSPTGKQTLWD